MAATVFDLPPEIITNIKQYASSKGITPDDVVIGWAKKLIPAVPLLEPRDEWERKLLSATTCDGVSLSDEAVGSEGIYN